MSTVLIVAVVLVVLVVSTAVAYLLYYQTISIAYLKSQGKVKEIVDIFQGDHGDSHRRRESLTALVELATPVTIEPLMICLAARRDALHDQILAELPHVGVPLYPYLHKAFRNPHRRPDVLHIMKLMGADSYHLLYPFLIDPAPGLQNESAQMLDVLGWKPENDATGAAYWIVKKQPQKCAAIGAPAVPLLVAALKDPELCEGVIETLGELRDPSAGWHLLNLGKSAQYTLPVIKAIAKWETAGLPLLIEALKNPDQKLQQLALNALDLFNWNPPADEVGARYWVAKRRWNKCIELGAVALPPLYEALLDTDRQVCKDAAHTLGVLGQESAVDQLLQALKHPDAGVRQSVVEALGHFHTLKAVNMLVGLLGEEELFPGAVAALAEIGQPAMDPLIDALRMPDLKVRRGAAEALERIGWIPENDPSGAAYWIARQDWVKCAQAGETAVDLLLLELENPLTCANAANALGQIGDKRAVEPIISALGDKPGTVQRVLVGALARFGTSAVDPLMAALESGRVELLPVIQALGAIGDERAARSLAGFLKDDYPWSIREAASLALGGIGLPALEAIFEVLRGQDIDPRSAGIALGEAGKTSLARLVNALRSKEYDAQILVYALGKIPEEESATAILNAMQSGQYGQEIRNTAQAALLEIGIPAVKPLITALARSPMDQSFLCSILVQFGTQAVEPLVYIMKNIYDPVRIEAIVSVLGEIGDLRAVDALVDTLKVHNINSKTVNIALDNIWKKQRLEKSQH